MFSKVSTDDVVLLFCIYSRIPLEQEAVRPATTPPRMNSGALVGPSLVELRLSLGSFQSKRYQEAVRPDLNRTKSLKSHADGSPAAKSVATYPKFRSLCRLSSVFLVDLFGVILVLFRLLALK